MKHIILSLITTMNILSSASLMSTFEIDSLSQMNPSIPSETVYFFDIDETLIESPYMLGSKTWRRYIASATKLTGVNWHDKLSLMFAKKHPVISVEEQTANFLADIKERGGLVYGLTAREKNIWYKTPVEGIDVLTVAQLESVGINFDVEAADDVHTNIASHPDYYRGVLFAHTETKGELITELFKNSVHRPKKVVFVDDKKEQVEDVRKALDSLGIEHECYWYTPTDKKVSLFDPLLANIQLFYFWMSQGETILSDDEARRIANDNPGLDAEHYLRAVVK